MRPSQFNVVQLAVVLLCVMVFVAIVISMLGAPRGRGARRMQNATQMRGIHQGLIIYAQDNKGYYPGLNKLGEDDRVTVEERFQILFEDEFITPEYAINPYETELVEEWEGYYQVEGEAEPVTSKNYSYAMLQIPQQGARRDAWREALNSQAILLTDRNTGTAAKPSSVYVQPGERWRGAVLWDDNHVSFAVQDELDTMFGGTPTPKDRLFEAAGDDDALLIHSGNSAGS